VNKGYAYDPKKYIDPFLPRFKTIISRKNSHTFIDRYAGDEQFMGQTVYYKNKKPVFGMNYYGAIVDKKFKPAEVYAFLKKALKAKSPYRGLDGFREGFFLYRNHYKERFAMIEGEERIYYKKNLIYILKYHAGKISVTRSIKQWSRNLLPSKSINIKF